MNYIFSCFSGAGKTTAQKRNSEVVDLESSYFKYFNHCDVADIEANKGTKNRPVNPNFVEDYVEAIIENYRVNRVTFISMHQEVLDELTRRGIPFTVVYHDLHMKQQVMERLKGRGNSDAYCESIESKWEYFYEMYSALDNSMALNEETPFITDLLVKLNIIK